MLRAEPDTLFVFGDNLLRQGYGGQAAEMRDEPNAIGIPTKRSPSARANAFFTDADFKEANVAITEAFIRLAEHVVRSGKVVWPKDGVGTGLAQLPIRAPKIYERIQLLLKDLEDLAIEKHG